MVRVEPVPKYGDRWPVALYNGEINMDAVLEWLWNIDKMFNCVPYTIETSGKCENKSDKLRIEGNVHYKNRNFEKALELYNSSIMAAPHPVLKDEDLSTVTEISEEHDMYDFPRINLSSYGGISSDESKALSKAYANRSAVLFELGFYKKCLEDISLAIENGYPKDMIKKLDDRKRKCLSAQDSSLVNDRCLKQENRHKDTGAFGAESLFSGMVDALKEASSENNPLSLEEKLSSEAQRPPKMIKPNPKIPSMSSAVEVIDTPHCGRGIFATTDICTGDVLGVERAYIVGLDKDKVATYCSTCTDLCLTPIPCPGCSTVIFCSKTCRMRGLAEDHWYDCKILSMMISLDLGHKANAYKMFKTFSFEQLKTMEAELQKVPRDNSQILGFNAKGQYSSTSYQSFFHICQEPEHKSRGYLLGEGVLAYTIATFLEQSGRFFVNHLGESIAPTKKDFLETCKALYVSGGKKRLNSFDIRKDKKDADYVVFSALSLLNHSCYPSACVINFGRKSVLMATRPIKAGEEVTVTYRHPFELEGTAARQERLTDYNFECQCEACKGLWPTMGALPLVTFLCLNCSVPQPGGILICEICKRKFKKRSSADQKALSNKKKAFESARKDIGKASLKYAMKHPLSKEEFRSLLKSADIIQRHTYMPCNFPVTIKDLVVGLVMQGNSFDA